MTRYIVVEGTSDKVILETALPSEILEQVKIVVAGGRASALPLANSIAVAKQAPVALIIDADTTDPSRLRDEELNFQDLARLLPVETPPVLFLGEPDLSTSLENDAWFTRLLEFAEDQDYARSNPFKLR